MPNPDMPIGFQPKGELLRINEYVAAGLIYPGDPVKLTNAGKVSTGDTTDALVGIAMSYASGDLASVLVADHPDQLFIAQVNSADVDALTDINLNYEVALGTASTAYKQSRAEIAGASGSATAAIPIKVLKVVDSPDNALGSNVKVICKINNHQLGSSTGTAGV